MESITETTHKPVDFDRLWNYGDPAGTEARFRELLSDATVANDISYRLELLTQIARAQGLQQKFDDAHRTLNDVEKELTNTLTRARVRYALERGRVFNSSKMIDSARPLFLQAWELAVASGEDNYAVDAAHMMAIIEPPEETLRWNLKALEFAERSSNENARRWIGSLYNNIGWTYYPMGEFEIALEMFQKAWAWHAERVGSPTQIRIARWCVAKTLRALGRVEEALQMQRDLFNE